MSLADAEAVRVKEEPEWEDTDTNAIHMIDGDSGVKDTWEVPLQATECEVKQELESKASTLSDHIEQSDTTAHRHIQCMDKESTNKGDTNHLDKEVIVPPEELQRYKQLLASQGLTQQDDHKEQASSRNKKSLIKKKPIEKLYKCDHCNYESDCEESVQLHEKVHYTCVYCKYTAASEVSLLLHVSEHASKNLKTYARRSYAGAKQRGQGAQASLYLKQRVKAEPLNETGEQDRMECEVKVELESDVWSQADQIKHEVKEEQEQASEESVLSVSAAAAKTSLYTGHMVKEELFVAPEEVHTPKQLLASEGSTKQEEQIEQPVTKSVVNENLLILHSTCADKSYEYYDSALKVPIKKNQKAYTKKTSYKCIYCSYTNTNKNILQTHQRKHIGEEPFKCSECSFVCARRSKLRAHKSTHIKKPHKCTDCSYASKRTFQLKTHKMKHTGEKPYKCNYCSFASIFKNSVLFHESTHTGKKIYSCSDCSYKTNNIGDMNAHESRHETSKHIYKCAYCNFTAVRKLDLKNHVMSHTAEKPYKCVHCTFASAQRHVVKAHLNTHADVKYKCAHCSFTSLHKCSLISHIGTHSDEKPYPV